MRVLVTGANGFLGSWLTRKLVKLGYDVTVLRREKSDLSDILGIPARHVIGDVIDSNSLSKAFEDVDIVFHLAGLVAYSRLRRNTMNVVNVTGTQNVVDACLRNNVKRLVHVSSVAAVGASFDGSLMDETSPFNLSHLDLGYFETKKKGEEVVQQAVQSGLDAVILNPSQIYGPGDAKKTSRSVQMKIVKGKMPFYTHGGSSIIHVEDAVDALIAAIRKGHKGQRYILCGEPMLLKDIFKTVAFFAKAKPPKICLPTFWVRRLGPVGDILEKQKIKFPINSETAWISTLFHWYKCEKAKLELGFNPRPSVEAVKDSVHWMLKKS